MKKVLIFLIAVVVGFSQSVQAQNVTDQWGVHHWVGGVGGGGFFGGGNFQNFSNQSQTNTFRSENPTLEKLFYVGGAYLTIHEVLRYFKADKVEVKETPGGVLVVNRTNGKVEFFPAHSQSTATRAVDGQPRVEDWNGRDWGDPEIQEMKRESRRLEDKADAMRRFTDAQIELDNARQYREKQRPVAVAKPVAINGGERISELEKKLDEALRKIEELQRKQRVPVSESQQKPAEGGMNFQLDDFPDTPKPENSFNWQPAIPSKPEIVLANLTLEEQKFFGKDKGLVVTETFTPPKERKVFQKEGDHWARVK